MGSNLVVAPFSPEGDITMKTQQICAQCHEPPVFTEELVLLQIVQPRFFNGQLLLHPVLDDDTGDFQYEPYFLHFMCWEGIEEDLEEEISNTPPISDDHSPIQCRYCNSGIREWEKCGAVLMGELHVSKRAPNGERGEDFVGLGDPYLVCFYCLLIINDGILEFWENGVAQDHECGDCLQARCWRLDPGTTCPCPCHEDTEEEHE